MRVQDAMSALDIWITALLLSYHKAYYFIEKRNYISSGAKITFSYPHLKYLASGRRSIETRFLIFFFFACRVYKY